MKRTRAVGFLVLATCGGLAAISTGRASDHLDGPRATADPQADITDVFAFTSPENPSHVVLAMGVAPYASGTARFASGVDYAFRVRRVTAPNPLTIDPAPLDVVCTFDDAAAQSVRCVAPRGLAAEAAVGAIAAGDGGSSPMRVFAGLRSDPASFDRQGALATIATGRTAFTGQNAFAGANVLAIVVDLDTRAAFVPPAVDAGIDAAPTGDAGVVDGGADAASEGGVVSPRPILAVSAETIRRAP
jgi:hypothetical protein